MSWERIRREGWLAGCLVASNLWHPLAEFRRTVSIISRGSRASVSLPHETMRSSAKDMRARLYRRISSAHARLFSSLEIQSSWYYSFLLSFFFPYLLFFLLSFFVFHFSVSHWGKQTRYRSPWTCSPARWWIIFTSNKTRV